MEQPTETPTPERRRSGRFVGGLILIMAGLLSLVGQIPGVDVGNLFLPALGAIFLVAGLIAKKIGLLIPGGILAGIGVGASLIEGPFHYIEDPARGGIFLITFGAGWALITLTSFLIGSRVLWPLIPGAILALVGLATLSGDPGLQVLKLAGYGWPVLLIAVGLYLILRRKSLEK
jgi:hypothetical protein